VRLVKTPEEIKKIQGLYARCQFLNTRNLFVAFETTPEAVRALLPPPLEPMPEPLGSAWVGEIGNSNSVGPFMGAALYIRARYRRPSATTASQCPCPHLRRSRSTRTIRRAEEARQDHFERRTSLFGVRLNGHEMRFLSLRGRLTGHAATGRQHTPHFTSSTHRVPTASASIAPHLIHLRRHECREGRRARGELVFRESPHDPVADIGQTGC
jgi:hypothetical protein